VIATDPSSPQRRRRVYLAIAKVAFTSEDRVRDVIRNFSADGFSSLYPKYKGGHPPKFTLAQRREIKKIAKSKPAEHDLPFSTWSLAKLADFLVAEGVVDGKPCSADWSATGAANDGGAVVHVGEAQSGHVWQRSAGTVGTMVPGASGVCGLEVDGADDLVIDQ
jgi:hypothetical protein